MIKKIKNLRIKKRLFASNLITSAFLMVATVLAIVVLVYAVKRYDYVLTHYAFPQGDTGYALAALADMRSATRGAIGYEEQELIDRMVTTHAEHKKELASYLDLVESTLASEEDRAAYDKVIQALEAYYEVDTKVIELGATQDDIKSRQAQEMANSEMAPLYEKAYEALESLMQVNVTLGDEMQQSLTVILYIMLAVVILIIILAFFISTRLNASITATITQPMGELITRLREFAQGDISSPFPKNDVDDEVADVMHAVSTTTTKLQKIFEDLEKLLDDMADGNFNIHTSCEEEYIGEYEALLVSIRKMNRQMSDTLTEVKGAANTVSMGAGNLAESSQALAEGATDQAASAQELAATIDEITTAMGKTLQEAKDSYVKAEECATEAEKSRAEMASMTEAMNNISETSLKIGGIIAELEDIASQTNLLSLNASIEAARAGDAGRGFAVVADQIRNLAEQSATSAANTKTLIEGSIREVEVGNQAAIRTAEVLGNVVDSIHRIAAASNEISELAKKQSEAMQQANQGVERISEVIQANSAAAEESSATSEELSAQAMSMEDLVNRFQLRK